MRKLVITLFFLLFPIVLAFAEISIKAEVDKLEVFLDESITYKLIITSSEKKIPEPQLPKFEGFNVVTNAQSITDSFIKNAQIKAIVVYVYILSPLKTGEFTIKPSMIKARNKTYSSADFSIKVIPGKIGQGQ